MTISSGHGKTIDHGRAEAQALDLARQWLCKANLCHSPWQKFRLVWLRRSRVEAGDLMVAGTRPRIA
jgi:hypothetical protein